MPPFPMVVFLEREDDELPAWVEEATRRGYPPKVYVGIKWDDV